MERKIPLEQHIEAVEGAIDHIAYVRRMAETEGHNVEDFDAEVNRICTECHEKYAGMGKVQLAFHGMAEILKSDRADEFIAGLGNNFKE